MTDESIIDLYWAREEQAITESSDKYGAYCNTIAYNILTNHSDAEECVNDTYMRAWENIPPDSPVSHLYPYLARIVRCFSIDRYRHDHAQKRGAQMVVLTDEIDDCLKVRDHRDEIVDRLAFTESMNSFLSSLKKEQRCVAFRRSGYDTPVERSRPVHH